MGGDPPDEERERAPLSLLFDVAPNEDNESGDATTQSCVGDPNVPRPPLLLLLLPSIRMSISKSIDGAECRRLVGEEGREEDGMTIEGAGGGPATNAVASPAVGPGE